MHLRLRGTLFILAGMLFAFILSVSGQNQNADMIALAQGGKTPYRIVISEKADKSTRAVADDMAAILQEITGAVFPVAPDTEQPSPNEIVVGHDNSHLAGLNLAGVTDGFAEDEYEVRTLGARIIIAGAPPRGSINGMYGFLQDHLGCRWFTPGCSRIPKNSILKIGKIADRQKPAFQWRSTSPPQHWDAAWTARNRLSSCRVFGGAISVNSLMDDPRVATIRNYYESHFLSYVPASLYKEHPEYYAEINGKRALHSNANERAYCVSNPGFTKYMAEMLKPSLRARTGRYGYRPIVAIGQADNGKYCQCAECKASYGRVGIAGTYMEFGNRVAEEIEKDYPNAIIDTMAYGFTFKDTPVKMRPNVQITWCPIDHCHAHAFDECDANRDRDFLGILDRWRKNADLIQIWYYHYINEAFLPHMNLFATPRNFAEFRRRGVQGIYVEPTATSAGLRSNPAPDGDKLMPAYGGAKKDEYFTIPVGLRHLTSYVVCRLLWNPDFDVRQGINEFCETYYGGAGPEMEQAALMMESVDSYERTMGRTFASYRGVHQSSAPMLKWSVVEKMDDLFDRAEKKVAGDPVLLRRVRMLRLTHQMGILCYAPPDSLLRKKAFDGFFPLAEELGLRDFYRTGITQERVTLAEFKALVSDPKNIVIPGQEKTGANLLENSGFEIEINGDGIPDGWSAEGKYMPEEYELVPRGVAVDTTKAYAGKASARLTKEPSPGKTVCLRQRFEAKPGNRYRMSIRYQADVKVGAFYIIFTALDQDGKFLRHQGGNRGLTNTKGEWKILQVDTKVQDDTAGLMVEALFHDDKSEGVAWIDDFTCALIDN